eukprot:GSChrysophyteH1.ASY1.ANO1.233.1 assembled CDS
MKDPAAARLRKELKRLHDDPIPLLVASPREDNILEWRFVMRGSDDSEDPYRGGVYQGKLVFPPQYPWKPPAIYMLTPSGRFETGRRICLSISDYHPESWCPSWSVATILLGVISFFNGTDSTVGSMKTTLEAKIRYASESIAFNKKDPVFNELFGSSGDAAEAFAAAQATMTRLRMQRGGESGGPMKSMSAAVTAPSAPAPSAPALVSQKTSATSTSPAAAASGVDPSKTVFTGAKPADGKKKDGCVVM